MLDTSPSSILDLLVKAGPYALFLVTAYAWQLERRERVEAQRAMHQLALDGLKAMNEAANALKALRHRIRGADEDDP
jgi:hypothetical protein